MAKRKGDGWVKARRSYIQRKGKDNEAKFSIVGEERGGLIVGKMVWDKSNVPLVSENDYTQVKRKPKDIAEVRVQVAVARDGMRVLPAGSLEDPSTPVYSAAEGRMLADALIARFNEWDILSIKDRGTDDPHKMDPNSPPSDRWHRGITARNEVLAAEEVRRKVLKAITTGTWERPVEAMEGLQSTQSTLENGRDSSACSNGGCMCHKHHTWRKATLPPHIRCRKCGCRAIPNWSGSNPGCGRHGFIGCKVCNSSTNPVCLCGHREISHDPDGGDCSVPRCPCGTFRKVNP